MAWPSTPLTTYNPATTPAIKASDLNSFQTGINGIVNGTYSLNGLVLDGTGGSVVTPLAGALRVSRNPVNTSTTLALGEVNIGQVISGLAYIHSDGTLLKGVNVQGVAHPTQEKYVITWNTQLDTSGAGRFFFMGDCHFIFLGGFSDPRITFNPLNTNPSQLEILITSVIYPAAFTFSVAVIGA